MGHRYKKLERVTISHSMTDINHKAIPYGLLPSTLYLNEDSSSQIFRMIAETEQSFSI